MIPWHSWTGAPEHAPYDADYPLLDATLYFYLSLFTDRFDCPIHLTIYTIHVHPQPVTKGLQYLQIFTTKINPVNRILWNTQQPVSHCQRVYRSSFNPEPLQLKSDNGGFLFCGPIFQTGQYISSALAVRNNLLAIGSATALILCIGLTAAFYALDYIPGFEREFDLTDTSIQHSFTQHERVSNAMLLIYVVAAPLVILPIINIITIRSWWDWHNSCLDLILSLSLTGVVSQVVKVLVGRPRPDLIARCMPPVGATNNPVFGLSTSAICTQTDKFIMRDGFRSFPSAHSSLSFAGLGFLSFYLAGKLHLFDERGYSGKAWVALTPFVGAAVIAISRTMDYRHHPTDVMTGSTLGVIFALFSYRQYYPSLFGTLSQRPYSPRIPSLKRVPVPVVDIEQGNIINSDHSGDSTGAHRADRPIERPLAPGRPPYEQASSSSTYLAPNQYPPTQGLQPGVRESYEIDATSIDGAVKRPRQDLEEEWKRGGQQHEQG